MRASLQPFCTRMSRTQPSANLLTRQRSARSQSGAVVHGDAHFRQLLQVEGDLTGVIDWVDICRADVGQDLQLP